jgi:8-oxo-dGTP pyrophosphatase MutT (NUDIX family)
MYSENFKERNLKQKRYFIRDSKSVHKPKQKSVKKRSCGVVLINEKLDVLIIQEKTSGQYGFPKGSIEDKDKSEKDCAWREVKEEVGIDLNSLKFKELGSKRNNRMTMFILLLSESPKKIVKQEREIINYEWISLFDLTKDYRYEHIKRYNKSVSMLFPGKTSSCLEKIVEDYIVSIFIEAFIYCSPKKIV